MFKKLMKTIKEFIVDEYKFLICMFVFYIVCTFPVNYYIVVGGGVSDIESRIVVEDGYNSEGSFNISYVSELRGTILTYGLSYVIPSWDRESIDDYKYSESDDYDDIEFRGKLDLASANGSAIKTAYTLAEKDYKEISSKIYVIAIFDEYETNFEVQDELVSINGKSFETTSEYSSYVQEFDAGEEIEVEVVRDDKLQKIKCKLYEEEDRKIFGVALQQVKEYETDPEVEIKFKSEESGPSGGLITTLEIYNRLVKEDITNGFTVAGTGTVDDSGTVGSIGGVRYKVIGADAGGADVFLVPSGKNYEEAVKVKKEKNLDIKIIGVSTVEEAISELEKLGE